MNSKAEEIASRLREIGAAGLESRVREFESGLAEMSALDDPTCIPLLMELFDDRSAHDEVMFAIVHAVERFADAPYVANLLGQTQRLAKRAPRWLGVLYMRVLNSESAREQLAKQLKGASLEDRRAVIDVVDGIVARRPEFAQKMIAIRTATLL